MRASQSFGRFATPACAFAGGARSDKPNPAAALTRKSPIHERLPAGSPPRVLDVRFRLTQETFESRSDCAACPLLSLRAPSINSLKTKLAASVDMPAAG